jgi:6-pyruvoyl-tetrahydropterin synthase
MILFVRDLTVIDFSYLCQQRGLLGESYIVDVELHGDLDNTSMVFDFGNVKKVIKRAIDQLIDHKLAYAQATPELTISQHAEMQVLSLKSSRGLIEIASPAVAHVAVPGDAINFNTVSEFLTAQIQPLLPANVEKVLFNLRTEKSNGFYYHYSHGLKKHDGNCQRIAHGHRSTIEIFQNGMLTPRLNKYWTERWQDIYLGTAEDLSTAQQCYLLSASADKQYYFRYQAAQGEFQISLPESHCEIVPCDTTVECLAQYIADVLVTLEPASYKVVAYEGVGKGAIAFQTLN